MVEYPVETAEVRGNELIRLVRIGEPALRKVTGSGRIRQVDLAIQNDYLPALLAIYEKKGLLALAAKHLKDTNLKSFKSWINAHRSARRR